MRIAIAAVGRMKSGPERELVSRYLDRASASGKPLALTGFDVTELNESRAGSAASRLRAQISSRSSRRSWMAQATSSLGVHCTSIRFSSAPRASFSTFPAHPACRITRATDGKTTPKMLPMSFRWQ